MADLANYRAHRRELSLIESQLIERKEAEKALQSSGEAARRLARENAVLAGIGRIISSSLDIDEVYVKFTEQVRKLIPFDRVVITVLDSEQHTATASYVEGVDMPDRGHGQAHAIAGTLTEAVVRVRSGVIGGTDSAGGLLAQFPDEELAISVGLRSMIAVPLISGDRAIATLVIRSREANAYSEHELEVAAHAETHGKRRRERRALKARWRGERWRSVPSDSVVFRYLERFHDAGEEAKREAHRAFIPSPNDALKGLGKVNAGLVDFVQSRSPHTQATLDMDACLVESHKKEALYSYKKYRAYQPLTTYWAEADLVVHSEFRDGNVPAGHQQLRVLKEALGHLPVGVAKVMLRSDTAGYQQELLRYCAEGRDERFGVIEFAVGVDVTAEFRRAVSEVAEEDWHVLHKPGSNRVETGQEWAEVNFVPNWIGHSKNSPEYRFMATRERLIEQPLPAMEGQMKMPFPAMELSNRGWFKVFGVVTNRTLAGDEVIWWSRQRCGKGEEVHSVLKSDLAGGRLPSRLFGANAAWWAIAVLAFNLSSAMKRLVLGGQWVSRRLKAVRFALIALPGRVMRHARRLIIRLSRDHPSYELLLRARQNILALAAEPYRA